MSEDQNKDVEEYKALMDKLRRFIGSTTMSQQTILSQVKKNNTTRLILYGKIAETNPEGAQKLNIEYSDIIPTIRGLIEEEEKIIQRNVYEYFLKIFPNIQDKANFFKKNNGYQKGLIARIPQENNVVNYYVKTHQGGSTEDMSSFGTVDAKEILVYKLLERFNVGCQVHFFVARERSRSFYIATRDCNVDGYFVLRSNLEDTIAINEKHTLAFNICDAITRIFYLFDASSNPTNYGFLHKGDCILLRLVDFRTKLHTNYVYNNIIKGFLEKNGRLGYRETDTLVRNSKLEDRKFLNMTREFFTKNLIGFNTIVDYLHEEVISYIFSIREHLEVEGYEQDLLNYVRDIKINFKEFMEGNLPNQN